MKNKKATIFIAVCLVLCLIPSIGMLFFPTTRTSENKAMAEPPQLIADGALNMEFFSDFEEYFTQHLSLRNQMLYVDASIQTTLFDESSVSGVIYGTDGWLYYKSTLEDYAGTNVLSERELFGIANNLSIVQEYLEQREIDLVVTIPPNKNTLYSEYMPYYDSVTTGKPHNAERLKDYLTNVDYLDLFELFEGKNEVLYLKRDSHWSNRGALLAFESLMEHLGLTYTDYTEANPTFIKSADGDLNRMLYSFYGKTEADVDYGLTGGYTYESGDDVEDGWLITANDDGSGSLLMFRDSFANTLIPFLANEFEHGYFSKGMPNALERYVEAYVPDCVVIEKVERNISEFLDNPPVLTAVTAEVPAEYTISKTDSTISLDIAESDVNYLCISGTLDESRIDQNTTVTVTVNGTAYKAYLTGENGYLLYLKAAEVHDGADVRVYICRDDLTVEAAQSVLQ